MFGLLRWKTKASPYLYRDFRKPEVKPKMKPEQAIRILKQVPEQKIMKIQKIKIKKIKKIKNTVKSLKV